LPDIVFLCFVFCFWGSFVVFAPISDNFPITHVRCKQLPHFSSFPLFPSLPTHPFQFNLKLFADAIEMSACHPTWDDMFQQYRKLFLPCPHRQDTRRNFDRQSIVKNQQAQQPNRRVDIVAGSSI